MSINPKSQEPRFPIKLSHNPPKDMQDRQHAPNLCYGEIKREYETDAEGIKYLRCYYCTKCDIQDFDHIIPTPHELFIYLI